MPLSPKAHAPVHVPQPHAPAIWRTYGEVAAGVTAASRPVCVFFAREAFAPVSTPCSAAVTQAGSFAVIAPSSADTARSLDAVLPGARGWLISLGAPHGRRDDDAGEAPGVVLTAVTGDGEAADTAAPIVFAMPVHAFPGIANRLPARGSSRLSGVAAAILADHLHLLGRLLPGACEADLPVLAEATGTLMDACLGPRGAPTERSDVEAPSGPRARVEKVILENLSSARLDTRRICDLAGISRSALYRLFDDCGGVAAYVRVLRLELVRKDLADPELAQVPISTLAERRGLYCTPSFNRAFRRAFGRTPGDVRAEASDTRGLTVVSSAGSSPCEAADDGAWTLEAATRARSDGPRHGARTSPSAA